jgi:hypothetical protein
LVITLLMLIVIGVVALSWRNGRSSSST